MQLMFINVHLKAKVTAFKFETLLWPNDVSKERRVTSKTWRRAALLWQRRCQLKTKACDSSIGKKKSKKIRGCQQNLKQTQEIVAKWCNIEIQKITGSKNTSFLENELTLFQAPKKSFGELMWHEHIHALNWKLYLAYYVYLFSYSCTRFPSLDWIIRWSPLILLAFWFLTNYFLYCSDANIVSNTGDHIERSESFSFFF